MEPTVGKHLGWCKGRHNAHNVYAYHFGSARLAISAYLLALLD